MLEQGKKNYFLWFHTNQKTWFKNMETVYQNRILVFLERFYQFSYLTVYLWHR